MGIIILVSRGLSPVVSLCSVNIQAVSALHHFLSLSMGRHHSPEHYRWDFLVETTTTELRPGSGSEGLIIITESPLVKLV